MPEGRRLRRLQIGVVGRERVARGARVTCECRSLIGERVVKVAHGGARRQSEPDAKRLAARAARAQPAGGRTADAPLQLGLARVEGIAERRIPRELLTGDLVQLEQPAHERPRIVAREVSALDERDRVREIRERQAPSEPRSVCALGRVSSGDQLTGGATAQPPAPPELSCLCHQTETRELDVSEFRVSPGIRPCARCAAPTAVPLASARAGS